MQEHLRQRGDRSSQPADGRRNGRRPPCPPAGTPPLSPAPRRRRNCYPSRPKESRLAEWHDSGDDAHHRRPIRRHENPRLALWSDRGDPYGAWMKTSLCHRAAQSLATSTAMTPAGACAARRSRPTTARKPTRYCLLSLWYIQSGPRSRFVLAMSEFLRWTHQRRTVLARPGSFVALRRNEPRRRVSVGVSR